MSIPNKIILYKKLLGILIFFSVFYIGFSQEKIPQNNYVQGKLTNKLQFFIQKNKPKKEETLFYLILKAGSVQESNNELGYAHFLEHMAFKGGKRFTKKTFTQFLKEQGLQIGVNYNAVTHYDYTIYEIKVPQKANIALQKQIFSFFIDIINGLTLHQKDIEIEKKIVLAEKKVADNLQEHFLFKLGDGLYKKRNPIGTDKSINNITTKKLKNFYNKWYQPKNAGVFVVGSINPKQTAQIIKQIFSNSKNKTNISIAPKNLYKQLTNDVLVIIDTSKLKSKVHIEMAMPHKPKNKKEKITTKIFKNILQNRLDSVLKKYNANSRIYEDYFLSDVNYFSITTSVKKEIIKVIKDILVEIKRMSVFGVSEKELAYYVDNQKEKLNIKLKDFNNKYVANKLIDAFLGIEKLNPHKYHNDYLHNITNKAIQNKAIELWETAKKRFFIEIPKKQQKIITSTQLNSLWQEINSQKPKNTIFKVPKKEITKKYNYSLNAVSLSEKQPATKEYYPKLNITRIAYKNGLEVLLKPLPNQEKEIKIVGQVEGGTSFLNDSLYPQYASTVSYIDLGGVGNLNYNQLNNYLEDKNMGLSLNISEYQRFFGGFTEEKYKEEFFKYLYLKLTKPRVNNQDFKEVVSEEIEQAKKEKLAKTITSKEDFKIAELSGEYFPNRNIAEKVNDYKKLNLRKMRSFYKKAFSYSNNWKIIIVGSFNVKELLPLLNKYFGSLKKTRNPIKNKKIFDNNNFKNKYIFKADKQVKTVANTWLFYNNYAFGLKNTLLQSLFKKMLQDNILYLLREKYGFVYMATVDIERQKDYAVINISYNCKPSDMRKARKILIDWISNIMKNKISNTTFQSYKNQLLLQYKAMINSNNTYNWAFNLQNSIKNNNTVDELEKYEEILKEITISDFYKSIAKNFNINTLKRVEVVPN